MPYCTPDPSGARVFLRGREKMKTWSAAGTTIAAAVVILLWGAAAHAGSQELTDYMRKLTEAGDIPEMADDADLLLVHNGKSRRLTVDEAKKDNAHGRTLMHAFEIKNFKVKDASCDEKTCHAEYSYRIIAYLKNNTEIAAEVSCDEDYRVVGTRFILVRGRQVETTDTPS